MTPGTLHRIGLGLSFFTLMAAMMIIVEFIVWLQDSLLKETSHSRIAIIGLTAPASLFAFVCLVAKIIQVIATAFSLTISIS